MGSYLLLIAIVDWYYRGIYSVHDSYWRSSNLCSLAGFISTFSSELSVFTLTGKRISSYLKKTLKACLDSASFHATRRESLGARGAMHHQCVPLTPSCTETHVFFIAFVQLCIIWGVLGILFLV